MNCFQKLLSSWHDTTVKFEDEDEDRLWIAFKNYYLRDTTQLVKFLCFLDTSCELLSKIIIFVTRHNLNEAGYKPWTVVNCFQKLLSSWHDTTRQRESMNRTPLWIAFKNYYLRDTTQQYSQCLKHYYCCELLSKIIIFVTRHNDNNYQHPSSTVVNCFQKLLSSWHDTTIPHRFYSLNLLWIAFKNYYLRDTTQPAMMPEVSRFSCELLSKIIIFVTRHNCPRESVRRILVVNCFQKLLSSWHDTTWKLPAISQDQLWIAFKNYYLRDTTQLYTPTIFTITSCELLSKIIIFVTRHNEVTPL